LTSAHDDSEAEEFARLLEEPPPALLISQEEEIVRLREELDGIRQSAAWRISRVVDRIIGLPATIAQYVGMRVRVTPLHDVRKHANSSNVDDWEVIGPDPQVELHWANGRPLPNARYLFAVNSIDVRDETMNLYLDRGDGFTERDHVTLRYRRLGRRQQAARFILPKEAKRLRLDPHEDTQLIQLHAPRLRRLSVLEYYARSLAWRIDDYVAQGHSRRAALGYVMKLARERGLRAMAAELRAEGSAPAPERGGASAKRRPLLYAIGKAKSLVRNAPISPKVKQRLRARLLSSPALRNLSVAEIASRPDSGQVQLGEADLAVALGPSVYTDYVAQVLSLPSPATSLGISYVPKLPDDADFSRAALSVVAFYLPQFHPIPENDAWWGKGFTEWTNVTKAVPQYVGHYQPHLPGELGFYDLRLPEIMRQQAELARAYGVRGFCFHHYWFGGKRLLERPVQQLLEDRSIDVEFCLCWANENWTRRWDGQESDVLLAQNHSPEDDLAFIDDIAPALKDPRYIRVDGRAVLVVYRVSLLPDAAATASRWRARAKELGVGELYLVCAQTFGIEDPRPYGFDGAIEFPPHMAVSGDIRDQLQIVNPQFSGQVYSYEDMASSYLARPQPDYPVIKTVSPGWDNEARKPGRGHNFHGANPGSYARWLRRAGEATLKRVEEGTKQPPLVFVNAWNEWAEGAHLEPDRKFGYGNLHATANVVRNTIPMSAELRGLVLESQAAFAKRSDTALVLHLHYTDLIEEILPFLHSAAEADLFVTLPASAAASIARRLLEEFPNARLDCYANRGRDVYPFLELLQVINTLEYDYCCKVHGKKSMHRSDGHQLRADAFRSLLGSSAVVSKHLTLLREDPTVGLIAPPASVLELAEPSRVTFNRRWLETLGSRIGLIDVAEDPDSRFIAGTMFWCRLSALAPLLALNLTIEQFEDEAGQSDGTLAHAVERIIGAVSAKSGLRIVEAAIATEAAEPGSNRV